MTLHTMWFAAPPSSLSASRAPEEVVESRSNPRGEIVVGTSGRSTFEGCRWRPEQLSQQQTLADSGSALAAFPARHGCWGCADVGGDIGLAPPRALTSLPDETPCIVLAYAGHPNEATTTGHDQRTTHAMRTTSRDMRLSS
jgi:hypothetical protein